MSKKKLSRNQPAPAAAPAAKQPLVAAPHLRDLPSGTKLVWNKPAYTGRGGWHQQQAELFWGAATVGEFVAACKQGPRPLPGVYWKIHASRGDVAVKT